MNRPLLNRPVGWFFRILRTYAAPTALRHPAAACAYRVPAGLPTPTPPLPSLPARLLMVAGRRKDEKAATWRWGIHARRLPAIPTAGIPCRLPPDSSNSTSVYVNIIIHGCLCGILLIFHSGGPISTVPGPWWPAIATDMQTAWPITYGCVYDSHTMGGWECDIVPPLPFMQEPIAPTPATFCDVPCAYHYTGYIATLPALPPTPARAHHHTPATHCPTLPCPLTLHTTPPHTCLGVLGGWFGSNVPFAPCPCGQHYNCHCCWTVCTVVTLRCAGWWAVGTVPRCLHTPACPPHPTRTPPLPTACPHLPATLPSPLRPHSTTFNHHARQCRGQ